MLALFMINNSCLKQTLYFILQLINFKIFRYWMEKEGVIQCSENVKIGLSTNNGQWNKIKITGKTNSDLRLWLKEHDCL